MNLNEFMNKWASKLATPVAELKKEYEELLGKERQANPEAQDKWETAAMHKLSIIYRRHLTSPAVVWEGIIIRGGSLIDGTRSQRLAAQKLWKEDPQRAIKAGICNEDGEPLDTRKTFENGKENNKFGKPLPKYSWFRTIAGVAAEREGQIGPIKFQMSINGKMAKNRPLEFVPVKFKGINKGIKDGVLTLNHSVLTNFEAMEGLKLPKVDEIIQKFFTNAIVTFDNLEEYHETNKDNRGRFCFIRGEVADLNNEPTSVGNKKLVIFDENQDILDPDVETKNCLCWVPEDCDLNFGIGSKVWVGGRTGRGNKRLEDGSWSTEKDGPILLNAECVYAIPEHKVYVDVEPITAPEESAIETIEEESEEEVPEGGW